MATVAKLIPAIASVASAVMVSTPAHLRGRGVLAPMVMHMYEQDCGPKDDDRSSFIQNGQVPENIKPYETVFKDGYYEVDCVKDYVLEHGDKYGDNKFSYNVVEVANTSIIRYTDLVNKEDREEMTHQVCFSFCRTLEDMSFFGLHNGRECYCSPFYKAEASDSSMCDAPCDGDATTMCGGKSKSSIFGMHQCNNAAAKVQAAKGSLTDVHNVLAELIIKTENFETGMSDTIGEFQPRFSKAGDVGASNILQQGKAFLGDLDKVREVAEKVSTEFNPVEFEGKEQPAQGANDYDRARQNDNLLAEVRRGIVQHEEATETLNAMMKVKLELAEVDTANTSKQYYPAMYFVDKEFEESPSTCTGTPTGQPLYASHDDCAYVCNQDVHSCVGFSFYPEAGTNGVCFFFNKLKTLTYYTGCDQTHTNTGASCQVKYTKFDGTSLKPDGSGKCEHCLKEAKKAERCF